jgi:hypothetical protein
MARSVPFDIASTVTSSLPTAAAPKRSLLRRIYDAMVESQQRRAEREIANYLQRGGVKFTDHVEREIERRFLDLPQARL